MRDWRLSTEGTRGPVTVRLPSHLEDFVASTVGEYQLSTEIALPRELRGVDLELGTVCGSALWDLFVADEPMPLALHDDLLETYRPTGGRAFRIPARATRADVLDLRLVVQHTWTQSVWLDCPPTIAAVPPGLTHARVVSRLNQASNWMALVTLFIQGTYLLLLWFGDKRLKFTGLFSLQLVCATVMPLHQLGLLQPLFGPQDTAFLGMGLATAIIVSVHATNAQFGLRRPGWFWQGILGLNVLAAVVAGGPFAATQVLGPVTIGSLLAGLGHNVAVCLRMRHQPEHRRGAIMGLFAWLSLLAAAGMDFVPWLGGGELLGGLRIAGLGLTLYATFQFLGMGTEYLRSLAQADDLNKQLAKRIEQAEASQHEIQKLNDELRRQVSERSRQLLAALLPVDEGSTPQAHLGPGELIEGRYKIVREIASGGMGQVYEAIRQDDGRVLAIKVSLELDTSARARIVREAQVASRIVHPNLVSVMDVGVASTGYVYLVMEYVDGTALDRWTQRFGDVRWALPVLSQIARALSALHSTGLVHRDLKPANVLLTFPGKDPSRPPLVKLGDFGISKSHHQRLGGSDPPPKTGTADNLKERSPNATVPMKSERSFFKAIGSAKRRVSDAPLPDLTDDPSNEIPDLTAAGVVLGTPMYVAPELASRWAEVSPAADLYAFGVLVFNVLGRSTPFAQPLFYLSRAGQSCPPACSIATVCPQLPDYLVEALDACLSIEPGKRPSARRVGELLDKAIEQLSTPKDVALP